MATSVVKLHQPLPDVRIYEGDVRKALREIPDESVQCVVTSPPYFGLRDYGTATWEGGDPNCDHMGSPIRTRANINANCGTGTDRKNREIREFYREVCGKCGARRVDRQIGLEPTVDDYVQTMVEVFREVRRVLRKDGTIWLNLGDSFNGSGRDPRLKPKDLMMIPARVALALQADGWWLRQKITWCKKAPLPESVTDRPTSATEEIFLLAKSPRYFYDAEAVREPTSGSYNGSSFTKGKTLIARVSLARVGEGERVERPGRNLWNYWILGPEPFPEAHFAVFPSAIPQKAIMAGTSPMACPHCGAPWKRVVEVEWGQGEGKPYDSKRPDELVFRGRNRPSKRIELGWQPTCSCEGNDGSGKCVVLDPFHGSGTTMQVALQLGRAYVGCELNPEYIAMSLRTRLRNLQPTLLGRLG